VSAAGFLVVSFINHLIRGKFQKFKAAVAIKQSIAGLMFPYSVILIFVMVDRSLLQAISDVERFLSIAGMVLTILAISTLFRIG
jgi:hypothetical protein